MSIDLSSSGDNDKFAKNALSKEINKQPPKSIYTRIISASGSKDEKEETANKYKQLQNMNTMANSNFESKEYK